MIEFDLQGHEFIPLNTLLKLLSLVRSGGEANQVIDDGLAKVNGVVEKQRRKKLRAGDKIMFQKTSVVVK
jgi:ribosome-associated protein